jgi:hypothetical protein
MSTANHLEEDAVLLVEIAEANPILLVQGLFVVRHELTHVADLVAAEKLGQLGHDRDVGIKPDRRTVRRAATI